MTKTQARHLEALPLSVLHGFHGLSGEILLDLRNKGLLERAIIVDPCYPTRGTWQFTITPSGQRALDEYRKKEGAK